jgi:hypothetical protein
MLYPHFLLLIAARENNMSYNKNEQKIAQLKENRYLANAEWKVVRHSILCTRKSIV